MRTVYTVKKYVVVLTTLLNSGYLNNLQMSEYLGLKVVILTTLLNSGYLNNYLGGRPVGVGIIGNCLGTRAIRELRFG